MLTLVLHVLLGASTVEAAPSAAEPAVLDRTAARVGLDVSLVGRTVRDDLLIPLSFGGGGLRLGGRFERRVGPGELGFSLRADFAAHANRFGHLAASIGHAVRGAYVLPLWRGPAWGLWLGPAAGLTADVAYLASWDDAHGYWAGTRWLAPELRLTHTLASGEGLAFAIDFGVIGWVSRPPVYRYAKQDPITSPEFYLVDPYRGGQLAWPGNWQQVHLTAEWVGRRWSVALDARAFHVTAPADAVWVEVGLRSTWRWEPFR